MMKKLSPLLLLIAATSVQVTAEEASTEQAAAEQVTAKQEPLTERKKLLGDLGGSRPSYVEDGVNIDLEYTGVYQGSAAGTKRNESDYFGRFDIMATFDTDKLGLWEGGAFYTQVQAHHGNTQEFGFGYTGSPFVAPNTAGFFGDDLFVSSFYYAHKFDGASLLVGKLDAFELLKNAPFYGGAGRYGFMNLALAAPPSGVVPPSFLGALLNWNTDNFNWTLMVFDPKNRYTSDYLSDPFDTGVNISLTASHTRKIAGRSSNITLSGTYSTKDGQDLNNILDPDALSENMYNIRLGLSHNLYESEIDPSISWGVYLRAAIADGNPNALEGTFSVGVGGKALFPKRPMDQWGVGYFRSNLSDAAQNSINNIPVTELELVDEQGLEIFYSYEMTPAINLTTDVQIIEPTVQNDDRAVVAGLRVNMRF